VGAEFGGGAGHCFFEFLREFAGDEKPALRAEFGFDFIEKFEDAVGGFVENDWGGKGGEFLQAAAARGSLVVEEAFEEESAAFGLAAESDGGGQGAGAGNHGDEQARRADGGGGAGTGIGDARHAGVGDERQGFTRADAAEDFFLAGALVELVAGDHGRDDAVAVEEPAGVAGIFGEDMGGRLQDAQGAQGDVLEVADGRADQIQTGYQR